MKPVLSRHSKRQPSKPRAGASTTRNGKPTSGKVDLTHVSSECILQVPIADIDISSRYRRDYGDLTPLAKSIKEIGLLQPIGVDEDYKLVFGGRRFLACRDILKRKTIEARIVKLSSLLRGEHDENTLRKDFTPSEKVAIAKALERELSERRGRPKKCLLEDELNGRTDEIVARKAGFRGRNGYRHAKKVVEKGSPTLIEAMDSSKITLTTAGRLADLPMEKQVELLNTDATIIRRAVGGLRQLMRQGKSAAESRSNGKHFASISSGQQPTANSTAEVWTRATIFDLKNHWETMKLILSPICDETQDIKMKLIEKRTIIRIMREAIELHCDLEREWAADQ